MADRHRPHVILHPGFHKTGTTTIQNFIRSNAKVLYPKCAIILPRRHETLTARFATKYETRKPIGALWSFRRALTSQLAKVELGKRPLIISEENLLGPVPGRLTTTPYERAPKLVQTAISTIRAHFGADTKVTLILTMRDTQSWLNSVYRHQVVKHRMILSETEFLDQIDPNFELARVVEDIAAVADHDDLVMPDFATTRELPFGLASPFVSLLNLPPKRRDMLTPVTAQNIGATGDVLAQCLELNRSSLPKAEVISRIAHLIDEQRQAYRKANSK